MKMYGECPGCKAESNQDAYMTAEIHCGCGYVWQLSGAPEAEDKVTGCVLSGPPTVVPEHPCMKDLRILRRRLADLVYYVSPEYMGLECLPLAEARKILKETRHYED